MNQPWRVKNLFHFLNSPEEDLWQFPLLSQVTVTKLKRISSSYIPLVLVFLFCFWQWRLDGQSSRKIPSLEDSILKLYFIRLTLTKDLWKAQPLKKKKSKIFSAAWTFIITVLQKNVNITLNKYIFKWS